MLRACVIPNKRRREISQIRASKNQRLRETEIREARMNYFIFTTTATRKGGQKVKNDAILKRKKTKEARKKPKKQKKK